MDNGDQHREDGCVHRSCHAFCVSHEEARKPSIPNNDLCQGCQPTVQRMSKGNVATPLGTTSSDTISSCSCQHEPRIQMYPELVEEEFQHQSEAALASSSNCIGPLPISYHHGLQPGTRCFDSAAIGDKYGMTYYLLAILSFVCLCGSVAADGEHLQHIINAWSCQLLLGVSAMAFAPLGYTMAKKAIHGVKVSSFGAHPDHGHNLKPYPASPPMLCNPGIRSDSHLLPDEAKPTLKDFSQGIGEDMTTAHLSRPPMPGQCKTFARNVPFVPPALRLSMSEGTGFGSLVGMGLMMTLVLVVIFLSGGIFLKWKSRKTLPFYKRPSTILSSLTVGAATAYGYLKNYGGKSAVKKGPTIAKEATLTAN